MNGFNNVADQHLFSSHIHMPHVSCNTSKLAQTHRTLRGVMSELKSSRPEHHYPHQKSLQLCQLLCVRWFYSKHHRKNKSAGYGEYLHKANSLCSNLYDNYCLNVSCYHSNGCVFNEGNESDMKTLINFTSREIYQPFTVITALTPISCLQKGESTVNMKLQSGFCGDTTWLICSSVSIFEAGTPKSIQIHQNGDGMGASWRG